MTYGEAEHSSTTESDGCGCSGCLSIICSIIGISLIYSAITTGFGQPMHSGAIQPMPALFMYFFYLGLVAIPSFLKFARPNFAKFFKIVLPLIILTGLASWYIRNTSSDSIVVTQLNNNPTSHGWRWYIKQNGAQSEAARSKWLPKATLAGAKYSITSLIQFKLDFSGKDHAAFRKQANEEIYRLHNEDLDNQLRRAIAEKSVSALRSFKEYAREGGKIIAVASDIVRERHDRYVYGSNAREIYERANKSGRIELKVSSVTKQANTEIHKFYVEALSNFKKQASDENPDLIPFFTRLLDWMEKHDTPEMPVIFNGPDAATIKILDEATLKDHGTNYLNKTFNKMVPIVPAFDYFKPEESQKREDFIANLLAEAFLKVFPNDIFRLQIGEGKAADNNPSMRVDYTIRPKRRPNGEVSVYTWSDNPNGKAYIGVNIKFTVTMMIPGDKETFDFPVVVEPPGTVYITGSSLAGTEAAKATVYDTMAIKAFEKLSLELRDVLFREGSDGFEAASFPERRMLRKVLAYFISMKTETKPSDVTRATAIFKHLTSEDISKSVMEAEVQVFRKIKSTGKDPLVELKEIAGKLKNVSAKKLVIKGAFYMATAEGEMNEQEKSFFGDLMGVLKLTKEQVMEMLDEK